MPCVRDQRRSFRDEVPAVLDVLRCIVRQSERHYVVPAQGLFEHRVHVWQQCAVLVRGQAVRADDGVELRLRLLLHVQVERDGEEECL